MSQWSKTKGKDNIVRLNFNLGKVVPTIASTQRRISILMCHPNSAKEVKTIKDFEETRQAMVHMTQFNEVRCQ
jgi:hypothetical protein